MGSLKYLIECFVLFVLQAQPGECLDQVEITEFVFEVCTTESLYESENCGHFV